MKKSHYTGMGHQGAGQGCIRTPQKVIKYHHHSHWRFNKRSEKSQETTATGKLEWKARDDRVRDLSFHLWFEICHPNSYTAEGSRCTAWTIWILPSHVTGDIG